MAGSKWSGFGKSVLIPMLIALSLYVIIFLILIPLYRRYRSNIVRYAQYTPLSSSLTQQTTSIFEPYLIEPSKTLVQKMRSAIGSAVRWLMVPSSWVWDHRMRGLGGGDSGSGSGGGGVRSSRRANGGGEDNDEDDEDDDDDGGLFDVESGEAMVGFTSRNGDERRNRLRGQRSGVDSRTADDDGGVDDSNRRLSRELEEGFRDDSGSEDSDEEVTAGRRTVSRRGSEIRR